MPRTAVAVARPPDAGRLRLGRWHLVALLLAIGAGWTVIAFTNNLGAINEATARADIVRAEAAGLEQRLARGQRELELVQTDPFLRMQARGYGMGLPGEQVFVLPNDTPPALTAPLTGSLPASGAGSPLEAWLDLLFGD